MNWIEISAEGLLKVFINSDMTIKEKLIQEMVEKLTDFNSLKPIFHQALSSAYDAGVETERERIFKNIGFLRQFLNERLDDKLLTDDDIINWLEGK